MFVVMKKQVPNVRYQWISTYIRIKAYDDKYLLEIQG